MAATDRLDIAYTTKPRTLALDLYTPAGTPPFPVIVWIHGGGWQSGTKSLSRDHPARRQRERGYAVASVEYRLSGEAIFPAQIQDCKAAVRFLRGHAREYGLDANRVAAWGSSAGGHLVALMGTSGGVAALEDPGQGDAGQSSRVQAVVDWYGPTDFLSTGPYSPGSAEAAMLGCAVTACPDRARAAGPLTYVDHGDPPFFIEHGTRDTTVKPLHSELLHAALLVAGVPSTYVLIEGAGHGGAEFMTAANVARIEAFLDGVLR
ncbi:MAG: alpha/beta hydrolase [Vicinamibacteria bacterium]|nr:alpha/beta hydrolase [Vicinamibacteria bacterium]